MRGLFSMEDRNTVSVKQYGWFYETIKGGLCFFGLFFCLFVFWGFFWGGGVGGVVLFSTLPVRKPSYILF
jgi:hypothetical protein